MKAQQTERANNSVEAKSESILEPSSKEIKTTEETISKTAINHFFKMFYDSYMANVKKYIIEKYCRGNINENNY